MESDGMSCGGGHVVMVTVPCPGHIIPATLVAKFLLSRGFRVSCFCTGINYPSVEDNLEQTFEGERIRFQPLIAASEFVSPGKQISDNISWMQAHSDAEMATRLETVMKALDPPPRAVISDLLVGWTQDVADGMRIARHVIYTMPANALLFSFACIPEGLPAGVAPVHPAGTWNSMVDSSHQFYDYMLRNTRRLPEASLLLVNTFDALEESFLHLLRTHLLRGNPGIHPGIHSGNPALKLDGVLSIGPLLRSAGQACTTPTQTVKEKACVEVEVEVMQWLDAQEPSTVLYISFGSLLTVTAVQLHELAFGLENSGRPFLWVCRAPFAPQVLPADANGAVLDGLPAGFVERVEGRGTLIRGWAPQETILAHASVGGFLSHCGWNSTLEALWAGTPIAAWPLAVEQRLTARYLANDLRVAVEVRKDDDGMVSRSEVVRAISVLMDDKAMRSRFFAMHERALSALKEGGSSRSNLQTLVDSINTRHPRQVDDASLENCT